MKFSKFWIPIVVMAAASSIHAENSPSLYNISLKNIDGESTSLKKYQGDVLLIVNVASKCGLTPQYEGLQKVFSKYQAKGFQILGFPCNDFGAQEPGTTDEIKEFCRVNYKVTFPMFDKLHVKGDKQHPLYAALTGKTSPFPGNVKWNFGKFLISRDGKILKRFAPRVKPDSAEVAKEIEAALGQ